ncbi:MAG: hypothetical protein H6924_10665 [Alphaproteobacteria bacterium]|nr:hypothetical protein [Alphaproteobacteria bacterium]
MKLPFAQFIKAHHISRAALTAGVLAAAIIFFVVGAGVRLLIGPVSLGPLRGTLAGAIHDALPGITLDYDQAAIEWDREEGRVNLVVLGARMYDGHGRVVAQAPKADIDLAAAPFLSGRFAVKRITLVGVQLTLVHTKDGGIRLGLQEDKGSADLIRRLSDVIETKGSSKSELESFAVRNARLAILDEPSGLYVVAPRASLRLRARGQSIALSFDADASISGRESHVTANLLLPPDNAPFSGDLSVSRLDLRALAANNKRYAALKNVPLIASASARFAMKPGGALDSADFDLTAAGDIPTALLRDKALHVKQLRLTGHYTGDGRKLTFQRVDLDAREGQVRGKGGANLIYADGALDHVQTHLAFDRIALDAPGLFPRAVTYQSAMVDGAYTPAARRIEISKATLSAPGFALAASGAVDLTDQGSPGLSAKAHIAPLPVRTLLRYWPLPVAPGAREWIDNNIFAGMIGPLDARCDFAPGMLDQVILPEDSVHMTFTMRGVEGSYIKGLTHATGVDGEALLTGDTFRANFSGGRIGPIRVSNGTAVIPTLHKVGTVGQFGVHVEGVMPDIMHLIDMTPLNYARKFGIDPAQTAGTASADLSFQVPMLADLPVDDVGVGVKAQVEDFGVTLGRIKVHDGSVAFDIDNAHLHQTGTIGLADSRMTVDWTEDFRTQDNITTRLTVKGPLTEAVRSELGVNLRRYFHGTVPVSAQISGHRGALVQADVAVDFTPALLSVPIVNLEKEIGEAANGRIMVNFGPGNTLVDETIRIDGPVLNATGTAVFGRDGDLTSLTFPSIKMGTLNDLAFQLRRGPAGSDYVLRGRSLDGSKIGRNGSGEKGRGPGGAPADDTPEGPFHISVQLQRLAMRDAVAIMPFSMDLTGVGDRPATLSMSGALAMGQGKDAVGAPIGANIVTVPEGRRLTLTAGDAGLLARGLFAFESMRGGALSATAVLPGRATGKSDPGSKTPDFTGSLTVTDFRMVNQSFLARLFSAGSLTGLGDLMGGEGMTLDRLTMPFSSKNNVISVNGARVAGPAIGASADGYIDRPKGVIALKGSLVPAFGLNSFISNVPVLGDLLASKKGEGIFGVTYSLTGDSEHPDISTNPLAMLTPGILRRIFEGHIPTAANAPSNQPQTKDAQTKDVQAKDAQAKEPQVKQPEPAPAPQSVPQQDVAPAEAQAARQ